MAKSKKQSKKSRLTPEQQRQVNEANRETAKKIYRFTERCIKGYYRWAGNLPKGKGRRSLGRLAPVLLLLVVIANVGNGSSEPTEPDQINDNGSQAAVEPVTPETEANPVEADVPSYPVTIVKTGLDFQETYEGELRVYADKTVVEATWRPECSDIAPVDYQKQDFTYTFPLDNSTVKSIRKYSDCQGQEGVLTEDGNLYQIDPDGTIRIDAIEPSDGSLIKEDFVVISGGPAPDLTAEGSSSPELTDESNLDNERYESERQTEKEDRAEEAVYVEPTPRVVYYSTCGEYKAAGMGNFTRNDPQYTAKLDRDNDGIACER